MHDRTRISKKWIRKAEEAGVCEEAIEWLREKPRTWGQLIRTHPGWNYWAMSDIPDFPIDLTGLGSFGRAWVMVCRKDYQISQGELLTLDSHDRVMVMVRRPDCPVVLDGLDSYDRAEVMIKRPDCPVDLSGLREDDREWVTRCRRDNKREAK